MKKWILVLIWGIFWSTPATAALNEKQYCEAMGTFGAGIFKMRAQKVVANPSEAMQGLSHTFVMWGIVNGYDEDDMRKISTDLSNIIIGIFTAENIDWEMVNTYYSGKQADSYHKTVIEGLTKGCYEINTLHK